MSRATLSSELQGLTPSGTEADAIQKLTAAFAAYCEEAVALTPILSAGIDLGVEAMEAELVGMNAPGAAAAKIAAGFQAFWNAVALGLATSFAGASAITPPSYAALPVMLQGVFYANRDLGRTLEESADVMATAIHVSTVPGGSVTTAGPAVTPIA